MELELQGWTVRLALAVLALFVVAAPLARAVYTNRDRAGTGIDAPSSPKSPSAACAR